MTAADRPEHRPGTLEKTWAVFCGVWMMISSALFAISALYDGMDIAPEGPRFVARSGRA